MVNINELHIRPSYKNDNSFGLVDDTLTREPIIFLATLNSHFVMKRNVDKVLDFMQSLLKSCKLSPN